MSTFLSLPLTAYSTPGMILQGTSLLYSSQLLPYFSLQRASSLYALSSSSTVKKAQ